MALCQCILGEFVQSGTRLKWRSHGNSVVGVHENMFGYEKPKYYALLGGDDLQLTPSAQVWNLQIILLY